MNRQILALTWLLLMTTTGARADAIDDHIEAEMARQQIPGLALLIMNGDSPPQLKGYGFANLEHQVPVTADTVFQSGSLGKQFTATAVLLLAEQRKLGLDDTLDRHFKQVPEAWRTITIRQLLTHTAGLKDYGAEVPLRQELSEDELLEIMKALPIEFEPGSDWRYSNSGYVVLGILVSRVTGAHWSEFVEKSVFAPAGMTTARLISDTDIVPNRAAGYVLPDDGPLRNQDWVSATLLSTGDGALYFTLRDLMHWETALRTRKILNADSYRAWWTPVTLNDGKSRPYGFGWAVSEIDGARVIQHGGAWQGFQTYYARYVDAGLTVAVLTNVDVADPETITQATAQLILRPADQGAGAPADVPPAAR
ncbi:MAG: serine hydrolase domain-containing protein [Pseudomonadota bacterium]